MEQGLSTPPLAHLQCVQHDDNALQENSTLVPLGQDENEKQDSPISPDTCSKLWKIVKETEEVKQANEDTKFTSKIRRERCSQMLTASQEVIEIACEANNLNSAQHDDVDVQVDSAQHVNVHVLPNSTTIIHKAEDTKDFCIIPPLQACSQVPMSAKAMEESEGIFPAPQNGIANCQASYLTEDTELSLAQINCIDSRESESYALTTPPKNTVDDANHTTKMRDKLMLSSSMEAHQLAWLSQDAIGPKPSTMHSFIMRRFLPAAQEIAAMENEHFKTLLASRNQITAVSSSSSKGQRPPVGHRIKAKTQQASKGFITTHSVHANQTDKSMPPTLKSCGFFCLGLKRAIFQVHCSVSASQRKHMPLHLAGNGSSHKISKKKEEINAVESSGHMDDTYKNCETASEIYGSAQQLAMECHSSWSQACESRVEWDPDQKHWGRLDVPSKIDEQVLSRREDERVLKGWATCNFSSPFGHAHAQNLREHDIVSASIDGSPFHILRNASEAERCPQQDLPKTERAVEEKCCLEPVPVWHDVDNNDDIDSPFFDALSRLDSVRSSASFYTLESPKSVCENLVLAKERGRKDGSGFVDALTEIEISPPFTSDNNKESVDHRSERQSQMNAETSSVSHVFGKDLKLETCKHASVQGTHSGYYCKYPHFEDICMLQEDDWRVASFQKVQHGYLDGNLLNSATVSPIFPAKCQGPTNVGWPFGISTYQSGMSGTRSDGNHPAKGLKVTLPGIPSPPLPPSPKGSWLGKAMSKNAINASPLATLQNKRKAASARRKLDFLDAMNNSETRWENVVKGSRLQTRS